MLVVAGLAIASMAVSGRARVRWSWVDLAALALFALVGWSAGRAAERRVAINLAWEWGGLALAYLLARALPRNRSESSALAGVLVASAVAVAAYGLYQVRFELEPLRLRFLADPAGTLRSIDLPDDARNRAMFASRLLHSNEPFSTFGLANSLAGFLVGPLILALAVGLENLRIGGRSSPGRWRAIALGAAPILVLAACLIATKSRSAYLGVLVASLVLAWRLRRAVPARLLAVAGGLGVLTLVGLVGLGIATRQLDIEVLTESTKSLRYRWEYWVGAWRVITEVPGAFWRGLGPGNFGGPYLRYKLPQASEEILDPHNFLLEVWATAGLPALVALLITLMLGLWVSLRPSTLELPNEPTSDEPSPPRSSSWLLVAGGLGWVGVVAIGELNPFESDLFGRWLILGGAWLAAVILGGIAWRRVPTPAAGCGAGVLAIAINLLAAGGIGFPVVALAFWMLLALGQNLREDRPAGQRRLAISRLGTCGLALIWAAFVGTFLGAIGPFWQSQAAISRAKDAVATAGLPDFDRARRAYAQAIAADKLNPDPWTELAMLEFQFWTSPASGGDNRVWPRILLALDSSVSPPRNPDSVSLQRRRAAMAHLIRNQLGANAQPGDELMIRTYIVRSTRLASQLYPANASIRAELAEASADLGMFPDAAREAHEALRLDDLMPHEDKKLPKEVRLRLESKVQEWESAPDPIPRP